jgi:uncharacterized protein YoxC
MPDKPKTASIKDVADAVKVPGESLSAFSKQWRELTPEDKEDLKKGVADGTMTY